MADPIDMIVPMLRELRAEVGAHRGETRESFKVLEGRMRALQEAQTSFRHALTADTLLSKLVTGEFEERIEALERKMREFESEKSEK
jgi:hypothetical protein